MPDIEKTGIITQIKDQEICVRIQQTTSCHGCQHKANCALNHCQEKILTLPLPSNFKANIGQKVKLHLSATQSVWALSLGFAVPLGVLLLSLILSLKIFHQTESFSTMIALSSVAVYYILLFLLQKKTNKLFTISISLE